VPRGAPVDVAAPALVLRYVWRDIHLSQLRDEAGIIAGLVGSVAPIPRS
jgi:hypothetical protein